MLKTKAWLEQKGIKPTAVSPEILIPILEEGSATEDEGLSDMFASLLANHLDNSKQFDIHPSFSKVLSQLSALDANVLIAYGKWVSYKAARDVGLRGGPLSIEFMAREANCSNQDTSLSSLNLARLGLIEHKGFQAPDDHSIPSIFEDSPEHQTYRIAEYGIIFLEACNYSSTHNKPSYN